MTEFKWRPRGTTALSPAIIPVTAPPTIQLPATLVEHAIAPIRSNTLILPEALRARYNKPAEPAFKASLQQLAYFDWIENGSGSALLEAVAGAGKTTTLIKGFPLMRGTIFCGAYNKSAAEDIKAKALAQKATRPGLFIGTMHGSGFYDWKRGHRLVEVDDRKVGKLIERFAEDFPAHKVAKDCYSFLGKMVSFGKQFLIGCHGKPEIDNYSMWLKLMEHFSADQDLPEGVQPEQAIEWAAEIFRNSKAQCAERIDFDDMIYAPIAHDVRLFPNDWVLVDECQDINPARREMAKRLMKAGGRAVFVGDRRQAVYGFTGAGGDSVERIIEEFGCATLPLTVTYRCPKAVVNYVHQWVDHIEAHPDAPEGIVRPVTYHPEPARNFKCEGCHGDGREMLNRGNGDVIDIPCSVCKDARTTPPLPWFQQDPPTTKDIIICRYTRPLIQTAYSMIKAGIACRVEGRDIGKGLIALARLWKITTLTRLEERLSVYLSREIQKAIAANSERRKQEVEDKVATLHIFIARCRMLGKTLISELVVEIEAMFSDDTTNVISLCTGHKAKGREWTRVFWIQTVQRGRPSKEWEFVEETNIKYVIGTRAQSELILVPESLTLNA